VQEQEMYLAHNKIKFMKYIYTLICFLFYLTTFANVEVVKIPTGVINFPSYCEQGKISIFIISTYGCAPCAACFEHLADRYKNKMDLVNIYDVLINKETDGKSVNADEYNNRPSITMWSFIEGCITPPKIYIFNQTGNPISITIGYDKEKIDKNIDMLINSAKYYRPNIVIRKGNNVAEIQTIDDRKPNVKLTKRVKLLEAELARLMKENKELKSKNVIGQIDSVKQINQTEIQTKDDDFIPTKHSEDNN
jgi:hypothetical protein